MEIRHAIHPEHVKTLDTQKICEQFLVKDLFVRDRLNMVYSHIDRIIAGGVCPVKGTVELQGSKELGADFFLQRREMGIVNIGAAGVVSVDGKGYELGNKECLYIGMGAKEVSFASANQDHPAEFYFNSAPAHAAYPIVKITLADAQRLDLGDPLKANVRTVYQLIHPKVLKSCQLVLGLTVLAPGSVWNSMPCHTHDRRMEIYFYFDMPADSVIFHLMGEPNETRHVVVRDRQAVISPSWSIHSGVGTGSYTFIWGMVGENQTFTDMDDVPMSALK
ncbi:MAG: 5-dehydro-4-deoxy-D-glucuronate isomerase [Deltaproteobacteria bacterium]|nr:5-dehydro-4-deoxy-D-glucuronate isomerase [Deltaproteobacteria bacterium]